MLFSPSRQAEARRQTDLYFNPPLERVGMLAWKRFAHIVAQGHAHAVATLSALQLGDFPLEPAPSPAHASRFRQPRASTMKIYYHPASTVSRPVMMFIEDNAVAVDFQLVDIFTGEHMGAAFGTVNPSHLVPVLEEDGFRLTESSAILKYIADTIDSPAYPKDLRQRARVNEMMDWINTQLCRDLAYGTVYAQIFPGHKRPGDEAQRVTVAWGQERAKTWMKVLDEKLLGSDKAYLCGDTITIADYYGASFVHLAEVIGSDLSAYPNVDAWLKRMKARPTWDKVYATINGFASQIPKGQLATV